MSKEISQDSDAEPVDAIREIIFGQHMRAYEARFEALEQRFTARINEALQAIESQLHALREETDQHSAQFNSAHEQLRTDLSQQASELEQALSQQRAELLTSISEQIDAVRTDNVDRGQVARLLREAADDFERR